MARPVASLRADQEEDIDERPWIGDLEDAEPADQEDAEELKVDDEPSWRVPARDPAPSLGNTFEVMSSLSRGRGRASAPYPPPRAAEAEGRSSATGSRKARLLEQIARNPDDPANVKRGADLAGLLAGGVVALRAELERRGVGEDLIRRAEARARG